MPNANNLAGKRAALLTLGCKLNFAETAAIGDRLREAGVSVSEDGRGADICVINTCSVTEAAEGKCRQAIRRMVRDNPGAAVVVTGCYAQLRPEAVSSIGGVSLVVGAERKGRIVECLSDVFNGGKPGSVRGGGPPVCPAAEIRSFFPACSCGNRTRHFLKVQDGCDYFCSYCAIPYARGRSRSPSTASLVEQARAAAAQGCKEIVLTGVNIGDFGRPAGETLAGLLKALEEVEGVGRYRISSIEPDLLTDDIISFCSASRKFMPHFHIPLQSGSDTVLRLMRRRYDTAFFAGRIEAVRSAMPDAFVGIDVIAGARGETERLFEETYGFLSALDFAQLHVFPYSERPGTQALRIPHAVPPEERRERARRLAELSERKRREFYGKYIGTRRKVLAERASGGGALRGFTDNYIRVELQGAGGGARGGFIAEALLTGFSEDGTALTGEMAGMA